MDVRSDTLFRQHSDRVSQLMQRLSDHQRATEGGGDVTEGAFANLLMRGIENVNASQIDSQYQIERLLSGDDSVNQAEVFTSVQKADMSFRMLVQIRNKLLQAFEELNAIRV